MRDGRTYHRWRNTEANLDGESQTWYIMLAVHELGIEARKSEKPDLYPLFSITGCVECSLLQSRIHFLIIPSMERVERTDIRDARRH